MALIISLAINQKTILTAEAVRVSEDPSGVYTYRVRVWGEGELDGERAQGKWEFELKHNYWDGAVVLSKKVHDILFEFEQMSELAPEPVECHRELSSTSKGRTEYSNGTVGGSVMFDCPDFGPGSYALGKTWTEEVVKEFVATQEQLARDLKARNTPTEEES